MGSQSCPADRTGIAPVYVCDRSGDGGTFVEQPALRDGGRTQPLQTYAHAFDLGNLGGDILRSRLSAANLRRRHSLRFQQTGQSRPRQSQQRIAPVGGCGQQAIRPPDVRLSNQLQSEPQVLAAEGSQFGRRLLEQADDHLLEHPRLRLDGRFELVVRRNRSGRRIHAHPVILHRLQQFDQPLALFCELRLHLPRIEPAYGAQVVISEQAELLEHILRKPKLRQALDVEPRQEGPFPARPDAEDGARRRTQRRQQRRIPVAGDAGLHAPGPDERPQIVVVHTHGRHERRVILDERSCLVKRAQKRLPAAYFQFRVPQADRGARTQPLHTVGGITRRERSERLSALERHDPSPGYDRDRTSLRMRPSLGPGREFRNMEPYYMHIYI